MAPPAATTASATLESGGRDTRPGRATAPDTCTVIRASGGRAPMISIGGGVVGSGHSTSAPPMATSATAPAAIHERSTGSDLVSAGYDAGKTLALRASSREGCPLPVT